MSATVHLEYTGHNDWLMTKTFSNVSVAKPMNGLLVVAYRESEREVSFSVPLWRVVSIEFYTEGPRDEA